MYATDRSMSTGLVLYLRISICYTAQDRLVLTISKPDTLVSNIQERQSTVLPAERHLG